MHKKNRKIVYSLGEVTNIAGILLRELDNCAVMTFEGSLGAGKTTLVSAMLQKVGVIPPIPSPTYSYVNIYEQNSGLVYYHFDLYRLHSLHDFLQAGFEEYVYAPSSKALIEWPAIAMSLLTHSVCYVTIDYHEDHAKRVITICVT